MTNTQLRAKIDRQYLELFNYLTSNNDEIATRPSEIKELRRYDVFDFYYLVEMQEQKIKKLTK